MCNYIYTNYYKSKKIIIVFSMSEIFINMEKHITKRNLGREPKVKLLIYLREYFLSFSN